MKIFRPFPIECPLESSHYANYVLGWLVVFPNQREYYLSWPTPEQLTALSVRDAQYIMAVMDTEQVAYDAAVERSSDAHYQRLDYEHEVTIRQEGLSALVREKAPEIWEEYQDRLDGKSKGAYSRELMLAKARMKIAEDAHARLSWGAQKILDEHSKEIATCPIKKGRHSPVCTVCDATQQESCGLEIDANYRAVEKLQKLESKSHRS